MFKKFIMYFFGFLMCFTLFSCNTVTPTGGTTPTPETEEKEPVETKGFVIHYNRNDGDYKPWCLWLWEPSKEGKIYEFKGQDDYGVFVSFEWSEWSENLEDSKLGFIVRDANWGKDVAEDRYIVFKNLTSDSNGYYHIYLKNGDSKIYSSSTGLLTDEISRCEFITYGTEEEILLNVRTSKEFSKFEVIYNEEIIVSSETAENDDKLILEKKGFKYSFGYEIPNLFDEYKVRVTFAESGKVITKIASMKGMYSTKAFDLKYGYDGQLGAIYSPQSTTFKVWSPISSDIKVLVYENGTPTNLGGNNICETYNMNLGDRGVWECTVNGDLEGKYYTYLVTNSYFKEVEVVDPYAKSAGVNGLRGMIVDFSKTNPTGWENVKVHAYKPTELTVYETHIADLTSSKTWNGTKENAKLFKGFYETGTKYTENGKTVSTGFDHIKELGVNAVQILPFFDQANDEREKSREFNWGYNPLNYNVLDGAYSSDPYDGYARIKEFKELVMAYNQAGINIIMDVVYNHVNILDGSNFDVLMPGYYFRYNSNTPANGSGCGNETASERYMFRKFMIDSTEFWASEYKLGGYRFDLMGLHDVETMNLLSKNLHENVDESIVVYGEPWGAGNPALSPDQMPAMQNNMYYYEGYGCFNDKIRDGLIKGGLNGATDKGWITNTSSVNAQDISDISAGLKGLVLSSSKTIEPEKCVNYVTCHDNYTLYDRIKAAGIKDEETIKKMAMLANSVVFTSQGITFMLAGEEFLRTKGGNSNSYNASYEVNELDYSLKIKHLDIFENYKKLIEFKQSKNVLNLDSEGCQSITINTQCANSVIIYDIADVENNVTYRIIHTNGVSGDKAVDLSGYSLYLDTLNSNLSLTANTQLSDYQTIIAYKNIN